MSPGRGRAIINIGNAAYLEKEAPGSIYSDRDLFEKAKAKQSGSLEEITALYDEIAKLYQEVKSDPDCGTYVENAQKSFEAYYHTVLDYDGKPGEFRIKAMSDRSGVLSGLSSLIGNITFLHHKLVNP